MPQQPKPAILIALIFFAAIKVYSQAPLPYRVLQNDSVKKQLLLKETNIRYEKDISALNTPHKKEITEIYKERTQSVVEKFANNEIITSAEEQSYLQSLSNEIFKSNPQLKNLDARLFFSRAWWPNASCIGEGTILFNIGLFHKLKNESQAVFVLCHELAHLYLNHGNESIFKYVNTINSKEYQETLKRIKKSEYQKGQQVEALAKTFVFNSRRHSRDHESVADSLALEFMKNSGYDLNEVLSCLALLDTADVDKYPVELKLASRFNFPSFPFKAYWVEKEKPLFLSEPEKETKQSLSFNDSLRTHPDCKLRIQSLAERVKKYNKPGNKKFVISEEKFNELKQQFDIEIIEYCYQTNRVSKSLYFTLAMLNKYPDNIYLHTMTGKCLNNLYISQKQHQLGKVSDLPSPDEKENYNQLLQLIQNLRLPEIAALSYYYLAQFETEVRFAGNEDFLATLIISKENYNKQEEKKNLIETYKKKFPKSNHSFLIN
jgi:hypothetical protein